MKLPSQIQRGQSIVESDNKPVLLVCVLKMPRSPVRLLFPRPRPPSLDVPEHQGAIHAVYAHHRALPALRVGGKEAWKLMDNSSTTAHQGGG